MRSLYVGILLSVVGTLALALVVFVDISDRVQRQYLYPVFEAMDQLELESARSAWESGGRAALQSYLDHLNQVFGSSHFFLDSHGADLVSGEQRGALLPPAPSAGSRDWVNGKYVVTHRSPNGGYWFVAVDQRHPDRWTFFPYYLLVIGVTGMLGWLAASFIVSPVRKVTATVDRFGKGDLSARANMKRNDEIGELARSFDGMAERLETLLLSERRLLQDISHELRSPLTRLKLAIRLTRTAPDPKTALDRVDRETNRITALVSEIIEMTRMEGDPLSRSAESVHIGQVVKETVDDCRIEAQLFRRCSIRVRGELSGEVVGDGELLRRAFENVLRNAIRYSPEGANIDVAVDDHSTMANLMVRDYGPGVPAELLNQIFEPFFRVEEARAEDTGGVGLGLSIAKRAVRLHRGTIVAENASPGLRVQISLPKVAG
jgi:signal transduction histidine kinase